MLAVSNLALCQKYFGVLLAPSIQPLHNATSLRKNTLDALHHEENAMTARMILAYCFWLLNLICRGSMNIFECRHACPARCLLKIPELTMARLG